MTIYLNILVVVNGQFFNCKILQMKINNLTISLVSLTKFC